MQLQRTAALLTCFFALCVFSWAQGFGTNPDPEESSGFLCSTETSPEFYQLFLDLKNSNTFDVANLYEPGGTAGLEPTTAVPYYFPVVFHIVREDNGAGGLDASRLPIAIEVLNKAFYKARIQFYLAGPLDYINNTRLSSYDAAQFPFVPGMLGWNTRDVELAQTNFVPDTINIYVAERVDQGVPTAISAIPGLPGNNAIIIGSENFPPQVMGTLPHEMGHYFGLLHTDNTLLSGPEYVTREPGQSNCGTAGDLLCDTPADPGPNENEENVNVQCDYIGDEIDPLGAYYDPDTKNLMSNHWSHCISRFSEQQRGAMFGFASAIDSRSRMAHSPPFTLWTSAGQVDLSLRPARREIAMGLNRDWDHNGIPDLNLLTYYLSSNSRGFAPIPSNPCVAQRRVPSEYPNIQAAVDASSHGDIILVENGTYSGPGNFNITVGSKRIVIRSENGPANCIIQLGGSFTTKRAFHFTNQSGFLPNPIPPLVLEGFTIRHGYAVNDNEDFSDTNCGGAILCQNSELLKISNCVFDGNIGNNGGAIFVSSGSPVQIERCIFTANSAVHRIVTMPSANQLNEDCFNFFEPGPLQGSVTHTGAKGGAIYFASRPNLPVQSCYFFTNSAALGGAMYLATGGEIENCVFVKNWAQIVNYAAPCTVVANTINYFSSNPSARGGGVYFQTSGSSSKMRHCTFRDNFILTNLNCGNCSTSGAPFVGDGVAVAGGNLSTLVIENGIFWDQRDYSFDLTRHGLTHSGLFTEISGGSIGAIRYCDVKGGVGGSTNLNIDPQFTFVNSQGSIDVYPFAFSNSVIFRAGEISPSSPCRNRAPIGRVTTAMDILNRPRINAPDLGAYELLLEVRNNAATTEHRGDFSEIKEAIESAVDFDRIRLDIGTYQGKGNRDLEFDGKKIHLFGGTHDPSYTVIDCEEDGRGFIFDQSDGPDAIVENLQIRRGFSPNFGGGIFSSGGSPTIRYCHITNCEAVQSGGGLFGDNNTGNWIVKDVIFSNNRAPLGGAVGSNGMGLVNCNLFSNVASQKGGAFWGGGFFSNCNFQNNKAEIPPDHTGVSTGGAIYAFLPVSANHCTFKNNDAARGEAIAFTVDSTHGPWVEVRNSILWDHDSDEFFNSGAAGFTPVSVLYSDVKGGFPGLGNINADPLLDIGLSLNSPCREAGYFVPSAFSIIYVLKRYEFDWNGYFRLEGEKPDMGALEGYGFPGGFFGASYP